MDEFMGGGTKSFPFDNIGDTITGVVMSPPEKLQQTDFEGNPRVWANGQPKWMYRITLQTDLRDPADPYDDGVRNIYVKWLSQTAVQAAVRAAGGRTIEPGGILTLTFSGVGQKKPGVPQPPKLWTAQYVAPQNGFMDNGSSPQAPMPTSPAPQTTYPATPQPAGASPAQQSVLERMRAQAAAARTGAPMAPAPAHHAQGEPPF